MFVSSQVDFMLSVFQESHALNMDKRETSHELHVIRARLQYFKDLLVTFRKSVEFVLKTPNPAMEVPAGVNDQARDDLEMRKIHGEELMQRECKTLLLEIERLERTREMMELRLRNVMALVGCYFPFSLLPLRTCRQTFGRIQIEDNKQRRLLTEASLVDNAGSWCAICSYNIIPNGTLLAMKQLTYLTMIFFPAGFVAVRFSCTFFHYMTLKVEHQNAFSMNIVEINPKGAGTLGQFLAAALSLTALSVYVIVAYQIEIKVPRAIVEDEDEATTSPYVGHARRRKRRESEEEILKMTAVERAFWPIVLIRTLLNRWKRKSERKSLIGLR